jgi:hypothetical protein
MHEQTSNQPHFRSSYRLRKTVAGISAFGLVLLTSCSDTQSGTHEPKYISCLEKPLEKIDATLDATKPGDSVIIGDLTPSAVGGGDNTYKVEIRYDSVGQSQEDASILASSAHDSSPGFGDTIGTIRAEGTHTLFDNRPDESGPAPYYKLTARILDKSNVRIDFTCLTP